MSRIEHILERLGIDLQEQERRAVEALSRLNGYQERSGQTFSLQAELDAKLAQLARLNADLLIRRFTDADHHRHGRFAAPAFHRRPV
jgi:hypothetical protein